MDLCFMYLDIDFDAWTFLMVRVFIFMYQILLSRLDTNLA